MSNNSTNFIIIYNEMLDNVAYTTEQIYLYAMLKTRYSPFLNLTDTTIELLAQDKILYKANTNTARKVVRIKELLVMLQERGAIQMEYEGELDRHTPLIIRFPDLGGHEQVTSVLFQQASDPDQFFILVTVKRFDKEPFNGIKKAKSAWGSMLRCSRNKGVSVIDMLIDEGKIYSVQGSKYPIEGGGINQEHTEWHLSKHIHELLAAEQNNEQLPAAAKEERIQEQPVILTTDSEQKDEPEQDIASLPPDESIKWGNWNNRAFIDKTDIELYVQQVHIKEFKDVADKKLASLPNKGGYALTKKIEELISQKQREANKNTIYIDGKATPVNASNIDSYRQYLIENFDNVIVDCYSRDDKKKITISLKAIAVVNIWDCPTSEAVREAVDAYIQIVKDDNELETFNFGDTRKRILDKYRVA